MIDSSSILCRASNLACERNQRTLFSDVSFRLERGQILHLKGPNGSGKTTLLRILAGLFIDYDGEIEWQKDQGLIYAGHQYAVQGQLTPLENLSFILSLQGIAVAREEIYQVLADFGLEDTRFSLCRELSEGQRKRVTLCRLKLIKRPIWLLDEPYSALDEAGAALLSDLCEQHLQSGGGLLMTSHQTIPIAHSIHTLELQPCL
jgi:heme exporter protein A